jgi:hypothetical protein
VDTIAAIAALRAGLAVHLVFPRGLLQEDGPLTPPRRAALAGAALYQLESPDFRYRTWTCVYLSDAVILVDPAGGDGCRETARAARALGRPLLAPDQVRAWPADAGSGARLLMIAGCRASQLAGAGPAAAARAAEQVAAIIAEVTPGPSR